jgi:hypothetical protein
MAEHGHSNYPAQLLESVCREVQCEQGGYPLMQQGVHPGAAEPYASRDVTSAPELPFSRAMDEAPFANPPMFRGVYPLTPVLWLTNFCSILCICAVCTRKQC